MTQSRKIVAVPVTADSSGRVVASLTGTGDASATLVSIVRGNNFNRPVYKGDVRIPLIRQAYTYLRSCRYNNNRSKVTDDELAEFAQRQTENPEIDDDDGAGAQAQGESGDNVAAASLNRNTPPKVIHSVFLPDKTFSPGKDSMPVAFLSMACPYSQTMPMFFPNMEGDVDDVGRDPERPVTERQWIGHHLRSVHKELSEFPLFVFTAAYRVDMKSFYAAFNSCKGYRHYSDGTLIHCDVDGDRMVGVVRGSSEYYKKQKADIRAKCDVLKYPSLFVSLTNSDAWQEFLATALSQDGRNIWHKDDEPGEGPPGPSEADYFDHISEAPPTDSNCPYHDRCMRVPINQVLDRDTQKDLMARNTYSLQRIFNQKTTSLIRHLIMSEVNGINAHSYHFVKEFGEALGLAHCHGLVWQCTVAAEDEALTKMHQGLVLTEEDKVIVADNLAPRTVTACLAAKELAKCFPDLTGLRSEEIVRLAAQHQVHACSTPCDMQNDTDGCKYHFPRLPSEYWIICSPVLPSDNRDETRHLESECRKVKMSVREVLRTLQSNGQLGVTSLDAVLLKAIGDVDAYEPTPLGFYKWKNGGLFPPCWTMTKWLLLFRAEGKPRPVLRALYHTAMSTATWHVEGNMVYQLVLKRTVAEAYVVDYNPYLLESMRSNLEVRIVTHTPDLLIDYITKAEKKPGSQSVIKDLHEKGEPISAAKIARRAEDYREVSLAEAYFRIDDTLTLAETNIPVVFINTNFPNMRGIMYQQDPSGSCLLPGRTGTFKQAEGTIAKYMKR